MRLLILLFCLTCANLIQAQDQCPCCTPAHALFDFWEGDWIVYDTLGVQIGENTIVKLEDNCILSEYWRGAGGTTGRSYNYYDRSDSTWNQVWIDNSGSNLVLKGRGEKDKMVLKSELITASSGTVYANRITWLKQPDGSVTQTWEIISETEELLQVLFIGVYRKRE